MKNPVRNHKGQFVIESVLLMVILVVGFMAAVNQLRENQVLAKLVGGPWARVAGMIESGVWMEPGPARQKHPNQIDRSLAVDPTKY